MSETPQTLGQFLKIIIKERHLTEREFAQAAGVGQSGLSNILSGKAREPDAKTLRAIARYLQIDAIILFRLCGYVPPPTRAYAAYSPLSLYMAHRIDDLPEERQRAVLHVIEALTADIETKFEIRAIRENPDPPAKLAGFTKSGWLREPVTQIGRWYLTKGQFATAHDIAPREDDEVFHGIHYRDLDAQFRRKLIAFLREVMSVTYSPEMVDEEDRDDDV